MATVTVKAIETFSDKDGKKLYILSHPLFNQITGSIEDVRKMKLDPEVERQKLKGLKEEVAAREAFLDALEALEDDYVRDPDIDVPEGILGGR